MKIVIVGGGYVGLSVGLLLAQSNEVVILDTDPVKVKKINERQSPILDDLVADFLSRDLIKVKATSLPENAYKDADFVIIATPTNYNEKNNTFDTLSVESTIRDAIKINKEAAIIIKSTVPVGFTEEMCSRFGTTRIIFSPEFLREGSALHDNLYPSRIIIGGTASEGKVFADLLVKSAWAAAEGIKVLYMSSSEAEAVKLFSNTYLAMRIAFFNELDAYSEVRGLSTVNIIEGVGMDPRIGNYYNNPSFGYGGYCLPKDSKQLLANYKDIPQSLIAAIVQANSIRKDHIADRIINMQPKRVGIYRLAMKQGSDNIRESSVQGIMKRVKAKGIDIVVFEPLLTEEFFFNSPIVNDLGRFKSMCDLIVCNRMSADLIDVQHKVYTRDIFGNG